MMMPPSAPLSQKGADGTRNSRGGRSKIRAADGRGRRSCWSGEQDPAQNLGLVRPTLPACAKELLMLLACQLLLDREDQVQTLRHLLLAAVPASGPGSGPILIGDPCILN